MAIQHKMDSEVKLGWQARQHLLHRHCRNQPVWVCLGADLYNMDTSVMSIEIDA